MKLNKLTCLLALIFVSGCATYDHVRPGEQGINRVVIQTNDKTKGQREAIAEANNFCKSNSKTSYAIFRKEANNYTGDMNEKTYVNGLRAAKVAKTAGAGLDSMGIVKHQKNTRNAGDLALLGGAAGDSALGDGYTVDMEFRCK